MNDEKTVSKSSFQVNTANEIHQPSYATHQAVVVFGFRIRDNGKDGCAGHGSHGGNRQKMPDFHITFSRVYPEHTISENALKSQLHRLICFRVMIRNPLFRLCETYECRYDSDFNEIDI